MFKNYFTNFGFNPKSEASNDFKDIEYGPKKSQETTLIWTALIYVFLSLGILLRRAVNFPEPMHGINTAVFEVGVIVASFIIGLAMLAPLLRVISRFHKGKLSWQHCLTAFSIGFFGDMTFNFLIDIFVGILKPL
ncbi:hypothetical protein [Flavobacterium ajazii]|uniref:hypothetical protein n=1 Tax=Flavobacterium ajazii TaxID=2692318 RepID=UPI0013D1C83B|nr:hypothetical protein [Flavobacterium ajazii]